jgi:hypothetical protein
MPGISEEILPDGSQTINITTDYGVQEVANVSLDGLADAASSTNLVYDNISGATNAKVVLIIQKVTPTGTPNIRIDNGTSYYQLTVDTTASAKRVEFNDIPASFLASFTIINNLGVAFPVSGNTCTIYPV